MDSHLTTLTEIAFVIAAAVIAGLLLIRLRQPPLVGFILAGVALGPTGFGFIDQSEQVSLLAEMGVLILLFIVGMELSVKAFVRVLTPALLTVIGQVMVAAALSYLAAWYLGWSWQTAIVFAFIVALSSTAVAMKILEDVGELRTLTGQITVGVLIAQDLAVVPMLILVESFDDGQLDVAAVIPRLALALALLGGLLVWFSRHGKLKIAGADQLEKRPDLLALIALAICFGSSAVSGLLGLSPVFGAFLSGLAVGNTNLRSAIIAVAGPIQSVLLVVFFLSIGLLIDLDYIMANALTVVAVATGVIALKTLINVALLRTAGQPWDRAAEAGLVTAQCGEFSFVIAAAGLARGALDGATHNLALAVIGLSLLISPLWMDGVRRVQRAQRLHDDARWLASIGTHRRVERSWSLGQLLSWLRQQR